MNEGRLAGRKLVRRFGDGGRGMYMSEKDIQSALWGQPAAMLPLPVYRWYSSRPGL